MRNKVGQLAIRLLGSLVVCALVGWLVYERVLASQLDQLALQSRQHAEFYRLNLEFLLSRNSSLPRVLATENRLRRLLRNPGHEGEKLDANEYLRTIRSVTGINAAFLMDRNGRTLASSNYQLALSYVGKNNAFRPYFRDALQKGEGGFFGIDTTTGDPCYFLATAISENGETIGVVAIKISLDDFELAMARSGDQVLMVDERGVIFLTSVPNWKYSSLHALDASAIAEIQAARQYHVWQIQALQTSLPLQEGPQVVRLALPDAPAEDYLIQSDRIVQPKWSIVLLRSTRQERQEALFAGGAAMFATASALLIAIYVNLRIRRSNERRRAADALRNAHRDLERRIVERTADLQATNVALKERIDAVRSTERILRETRDNAVQAGKLAVLGQMAAGITHEVSQPLTALHTLTDNAVDFLDRGLVGDVRENLGFIKQMAERMGRIVGEIKNFTRKPGIERQAVGVADVVCQANVLVAPRCRQTGARIDIAGIPADLAVLADSQRLEQVFVNLLLNGVDAVIDANDKSIFVTATREDRKIRIVVRDNGPGISDDALPHLFEPFFTTKSVGQGLGLGLVISRMIVGEFGGTLDAGNGEKGGAEFTVLLEAAE